VARHRFIDAEHLEDIDVGRVVHARDRLLHTEVTLGHLPARSGVLIVGGHRDIASARSMPVCARNLTHSRATHHDAAELVSSQSARLASFSISVTSCPLSTRSRER